MACKDIPSSKLQGLCSLGICIPPFLSAANQFQSVSYSRAGTPLLKTSISSVFNANQFLCSNSSLNFESLSGGSTPIRNNLIISEKATNVTCQSSLNIISLILPSNNLSFHLGVLVFLYSLWI